MWRSNRVHQLSSCSLPSVQPRFPAVLLPRPADWGLLLGGLKDIHTPTCAALERIRKRRWSCFTLEIFSHTAGGLFGSDKAVGQQNSNQVALNTIQAGQLRGPAYQLTLYQEYSSAGWDAGLKGRRENEDQEVIRPDIPACPVLRKARRRKSISALA